MLSKSMVRKRPVNLSITHKCGGLLHLRCPGGDCKRLRKERLDFLLKLP
jgi:hypothetical protein